MLAARKTVATDNGLRFVRRGMRGQSCCRLARMWMFWLWTRIRVSHLQESSAQLPDLAPFPVLLSRIQPHARISLHNLSCLALERTKPRKPCLWPGRWLHRLGSWSPSAIQMATGSGQEVHSGSVIACFARMDKAHTASPKAVPFSPARSSGDHKVVRVLPAKKLPKSCHNYMKKA
jgi:hypothetical protein